MSQAWKKCIHILVYMASSDTALANRQSCGHKSTVREDEEHSIPSHRPKRGNLPYHGRVAPDMDSFHL